MPRSSARATISHKMMRWLFSLLLPAAHPLPAQDIFGNIGGTIIDPAGAAVPHATVTITDSERNQIVRTATTGDTGTYSVPLIPFGVYTIKVAASGFRTEERRGVVLNVGDDLRIN